MATSTVHGGPPPSVNCVNRCLSRVVFDLASYHNINRVLFRTVLLHLLKFINKSRNGTSI